MSKHTKGIPYTLLPEAFLEWEKKTSDTLDFKKTYVDIAGDLKAGVMLAHIIYWSLPDKSGDLKLRVEKDGHFWIAVRRIDWWERVRLTEHEADTAIRKLLKAGLVVKKCYKFNGEPTVHVRLEVANFLAMWEKITQQKKTNSPTMSEPNTQSAGNGNGLKPKNVIPAKPQNDLGPWQESPSPFPKVPVTETSAINSNRKYNKDNLSKNNLSETIQSSSVFSDSSESWSADEMPF